MLSRARWFWVPQPPRGKMYINEPLKRVDSWQPQLSVLGSNQPVVWQKRTRERAPMTGLLFADIGSGRTMESPVWKERC